MMYKVVCRSVKELHEYYFTTSGDAIEKYGVEIWSGEHDSVTLLKKEEVLSCIDCWLIKHKDNGEG